MHNTFFLYLAMANTFDFVRSNLHFRFLASMDGHELGVYADIHVCFMELPL